MAKYSCFKCPEIGHDDTKKLDSKCPNCGLEYGFPLNDFPKKIGQYAIIEPISRGFYGAAYKVQNELLGTFFVLKVIPKEIYKLHKKDFNHECRSHAELASGSQYVVGIVGAEEGEITFGNGEIVDCHYQILNYVSGQTFKKVLESEKKLSAATIAQISIDLFRILDVLTTKQKNHNDLHAENIIIEELRKEEKRSGELDESIRVVAIDIGSLTSDNRAGDPPNRIGDVHWVAGYILKLVEMLLRDVDNVSDQDYRLASLLEDRAKLLFPAVEHSRATNFSEIVEDIVNCFNQQTLPWEDPLRLLNFKDTYNAQTLEPWFVPYLLVDPDNQWLNQICGKGPQVITGMRGCGKTMMLKALQFHARAASAKLEFAQNKEKQLSRLQEDGYIGIYVSCNKLLDELGKEAKEALHEPFSRLFIRYSIEAIKAIRHLKDISEESVKKDYYLEFIRVFKEQLTNSEVLDNISSERQLEQTLLSMIHSLNRGESNYLIKSNPANSFPVLAGLVRGCSSLWSNHYILFLLDDVSTRYLGKKNIKNLLSSLIFQAEECAFKITSEVQTIELLLYSPGKVEKAKQGRDFDTFNLGSAVNEKIRNRSKSGGKHFVQNILSRRAKGTPKHPKINPGELLGDATLKSIAEHIVTRGINKTEKNKIYHGISALAGVCVGDIGDIINLYDMILKNYKDKTPIPSEKQNEAFQDLCSVRLHEVNRRGSSYRDHALSFAQASHELLLQSNKEGSHRLRQYSSIYVRITTGDTERQNEKIRQLLDAGIFVYSGGTNAPRLLGNDTNPINQFKLTFRTLYGISNLVGLVQGDRFELTGNQVERWLDNPKDGKQILIDNVGGATSNIDEGDSTSEFNKEEQFEDQNQVLQTILNFEEDVKKSAYSQESLSKLIEQKKPKCKEISQEDLESQEFDFLIAGLGFEERTLDSLASLVRLKPKHSLLIKYEEEGKTEEILELFNNADLSYDMITYEKIKTAFSSHVGRILLDITGLSKSLIFNIVRDVLKTNTKIWFTHTQAESYYPLNERIQSVIDEYPEEDEISKLDIITEKVMKGEQGPYERYDLLMSDSDDSKRNMLIGFANAKYERLFDLLNSRSFDIINIICPTSESTRSNLALSAADVLSKKYSNAELHSIDSNEIDLNLSMLTKFYQQFYINQNFNFEFALTGSKRQTVACAAVSAAFKISHCWYLKPTVWNTDYFSKGIGPKSHFMISI